MHPVTEAIRQRALAGSRPGHRDDDLRIGLAIEGGGMRGVVSAGMAVGLHYLGLVDAFDAIYGSSAGAINGAFLIAGQAPYACTIYYQCINNEQFIDLRRFLSPRPVMSLEFLLDDVMADTRMFQAQSVIDSPIELHVIASDLELDRAVDVPYDSATMLTEALKASARIPGVAGDPVAIGGREYLDALLHEAIPFRSALANGCTHVLVLRSRPPEGKVSGDSSATRWLARQLDRWYPGLGRSSVLQPGNYARDLTELDDVSASESGPPFMYSVCAPRDAPLVDRLEKSHDKLLRGAALGMHGCIEAFTGQQTVVVEVLGPFDSQGREVRMT